MRARAQRARIGARHRQLSSTGLTGCWRCSTASCRRPSGSTIPTPSPICIPASRRGRQRVRVPETPMHLDAVLVDQDLTGGLEPRLGRAHLRTLTIMGFPSQTWPGLLDDLNPTGVSLSLVDGAICLDKTDATKVLSRIRRQWFAKRKFDHGDPQRGDDQRSIGADGRRMRPTRRSMPTSPCRNWAPIPWVRLMSPRPSRCGTMIHVSQKTVSVWSKDRSGSRFHLYARVRSMRSRHGWEVCPAMSMQTFASLPFRRSTLRI